MPNFEYLVGYLRMTFEAYGPKLSKPVGYLLAVIVAILLEKTKAHLSEIADGLPGEASTAGKRQRVRRFLSNKKLSPELFINVLLVLLKPLILSLPVIVLSMDRTSWVKRKKVVNILLVGIVFKGRTIPLNWLVLDRKGNTSTQQWKQLLKPVLEALSKLPWLRFVPIKVVADREFASPKLGGWLKKNFGVSYCLRLKRSEYVLLPGRRLIRLGQLVSSVKKGDYLFLKDVIVTKQSTFSTNVLISWGLDYDEAIIIMADSYSPEEIVEDYADRFCIEPMFRDHKSNAFDIEGTRVTDPKRIETLLIPIALAYALSVLEGNYQEEAGLAPKAPKGKPRLVSLFLSGLRTFKHRIHRWDISRFQLFIKEFFSRIFRMTSLYFSWLPPPVIKSVSY